MAIKVAVASSDGQTVNEHYGRASGFLVYALVDGAWQLVERRENRPACAGQAHNDDLLEQTADLVSDCRAVVISQIGATAMDTLLYRNILPFAMDDTIDGALAVVLSSKLFRVRCKIV